MLFISISHSSSLFQRYGTHVLLHSGPTGTGKTVNVAQYLQKGISESSVPLCLTFSAQTSANQTQASISKQIHEDQSSKCGDSN